MSEIPKSFFGPFVLHGKVRKRDHYPSLTHWVEANKLDAAIYASHRDEVLLTPSPKLALRRSRSIQGLWRSDWAMIRASVIEQGICLYYQNNEAMFGHFQVQADLTEQLCACGISQSVADVIHRSAVSTLAEPRVAFLGHGDAQFEEISKRLRILQRKYADKWTLVHWHGRHSGWSVHDWALSERKMVTYVGGPGARLVGAGLGALARTVDHLVVFEDKDDRPMDQIVVALREMGKTVDVGSRGQHVFVKSETPHEVRGGVGVANEHRGASPAEAAPMDDKKDGRKQVAQPSLF